MKLVSKIYLDDSIVEYWENTQGEIVEIVWDKIMELK